MSGRSGAGGAARGRGGGGRDGQGGRGGHGPGNNKHNRAKKSSYRGLAELKDNIFDCGKAEHAALYERSKRELAMYLRTKDGEYVLIAQGIDDMETPTIEPFATAGGDDP